MCTLVKSCSCQNSQIQLLLDHFTGLGAHEYTARLQKHIQKLFKSCALSTKTKLNKQNKSLAEKRNPRTPRPGMLRTDPKIPEI